jgi:hypothetical protein
LIHSLAHALQVSQPTLEQVQEASLTQNKNTLLTFTAVLYLRKLSLDVVTARLNAMGK